MRLYLFTYILFANIVIQEPFLNHLYFAINKTIIHLFS